MVQRCVLLLACCLPLFGENVTPKGFQAPLPMALLEEKAFVLPACVSLEEIYRKELSPFFIQTLAENGKRGEHLIMENGSEWQLNWFWSCKAKNWSSGDVIVFSHHPTNLLLPSVRIENLTRDAVVWGELYREPRLSSPETVSIEEIQQGQILALSNGLCLDTQAAGWIEYFHWEEGDVVLLMPHPCNKERYDIWNFRKNSIIADLPLDGFIID